MKLLHVAPIDGRLGSGLSYSIPALLNAQQKAGAVVKMLASGLDPEPITNADYPIIWKLNLGDNDKPDLNELVAWADIVIFHSTYIPFHWKVARIAKRHRVPMVITPRGGMNFCAGLIKPLKKFFGNHLFFNFIVSSCSAVHYLTENEAAGSQHWKRPFFVVPNGVSAISTNERAECCSRTVNMVFIGRVSIVHKGLDLLMEAIRLLQERPELPEFIVNIYGPGISQDLRNLRELIERKNLHACVKISSPVYGEEKDRILKNADVFLLTSRFEGHPMAVLEALSYGVPCIVSTGTNMSNEIEEAQAGWKCEVDADSISLAITNALLARKEYSHYRRAALDLAKSYSWDNIALQTLQQYQLVVDKYAL